MAGPLNVERGFAFDGQDFKLAFDMDAIAAFEDDTDLSILDVVQPASGKSPKLSVLGAMLKAGLARHHPEVTRGEAMRMVMDPQVQAVFTEGVQAAMPQAGDDGEAGSAEGNPPKREASKRGKRGDGKAS